MSWDRVRRAEAGARLVTSQETRGGRQCPDRADMYS